MTVYILLTFLSFFDIKSYSVYEQQIKLLRTDYTQFNDTSSLRIPALVFIG